MIGAEPPEAERVKEYAELKAASSSLAGVASISSGDMVRVAGSDVAVAVLPFRVLVTTTK